MAPLLRSIVALTLLTFVSNARCLPQSSEPKLPLNEVDNSGATPLPPPSGALKHVVLGAGFQNYTCTTAGTYVQNVSPAGAFARLYDITAEVSKSKRDHITKATLKALEACLKKTKCSPSASNGYCDNCYRMGEAFARRQPAGEHFFEQVNGTQTPNFDMSGSGDYLSAKKVGSAKAPSSAYSGANRLGAVDWLYLVDNASGRSHGMSSVYRVETAGGVAPKTCSTAGSLVQVPCVQTCSSRENWYRANRYADSDTLTIRGLKDGGKKAVAAKKGRATRISGSELFPRHQEPRNIDLDLVAPMLFYDITYQEREQLVHCY
ncbi:uncharacterized protein MYCGRDRAFT_88916 [Zymoseptoria tritici IPO323]|uniref:Ca2+-modulated nonselective cation channel polycystin n=1 Tax=Zymoseptoria tritici (strain CBS 115943 / IPO323) TaxID=336722 RepID=F9WXP8_ZYMTI|nr:uncharacterized protein MYCGRDRAFT_88916 [Zymoseptoria tritici IPO323]EGP90989.1 hypothetical protein MYCGRDRAFT_88916 [Zymoseptoria tritici IPO323]